MINLLKAVKNPDEISKIEKACKLGDEIFDYVLKKIKLGVTEKEIAQEIRLFAKKHGAGLSFPSIVAFGKNSSIPHHIPGNNKLTNNKIVLLDFGTKLNNYCSDMTRTLFFGSANKKFKNIYQVVLEAQEKAIQELKKLAKKNLKIKASEIDRISRGYIVSKGYPNIPHNLGHNIGKKVHELPRISPNSRSVLKEGMVFSIEPGIYLKNYGGVRIEDLVVLTKSDSRILTHSPKNIIEV